MARKKSEMSQDTKTIITILLLVFAYPVGLIMMFVWMDWKWWVKTLVLLPVISFVLIMISALSVIKPAIQINKAADAKALVEATTIISEMNQYYAENKSYPWGNRAGYASSDLAKEAWYSKFAARGADLAAIKTRMSLTQGKTGIRVCYQSMVEPKEICLPN